MAASTDAEFRASDLIGSAGVGANGEKLVNTLLDHYPPELQAAQLKRISDELTAQLDDKAMAQIAKIAGVEQIANAVVAGSGRAGDEAIVRYAWLDEQGAVWKGCFPYADLASGSSEQHVSQRKSVASGTAAAERRSVEAAKAEKPSRSAAKAEKPSRSAAKAEKPSRSAAKAENES